MKIELLKVENSDLEKLVEIKKKAFKKEFRRLAFTPEDMISYKWHEDMFKKSIYYKIVQNREIIGGVNIFTDKKEAYLCCLFINLEMQNRGIGQESINKLEKLHANINKWTLETPSSSSHNIAFYKKCGYEITDQYTPDGAPAGFSLNQFTKINN